MKQLKPRILILVEGEETAIKNANWLEKRNETELIKSPKHEINPYTDVHYLVDKIKKGFSIEHT